MEQVQALESFDAPRARRAGEMSNLSIYYISGGFITAFWAGVALLLI